MLLKEFVKKYSFDIQRGYCEYLFECKYDEYEGITIPDNFCILNSISRIPLFIVAVNKEERAIIIFDDELSLSVYDSEVQFDAALSMHKEYFKEKYRCKHGIQ